MLMPSSHEVTRLLLAWGAGDETALDDLVPLVYAELHRLARHYLSAESPGHILQTTALINEAYLKLADSRDIRCRRSLALRNWPSALMSPCFCR